MKKALTSEEQDFWQAHLRSLIPSERPQQPTVNDAEADNATITGYLIQLHMSGRKTGGRSVVEDSLSTPRDEGEGDLSLQYWRRVHAQLYTPRLAS